MTAITKKRLRKVLRAIPGGQLLVRSMRNLLARRRFAQIGDSGQVFRHHHDVNKWGCEESVSGPGSTIEYTENIRREIPRLVADLGVGVLLDAPCGDFRWFSRIEWDTDLRYIGGDIVEQLIARNQETYGDEKRSFLRLNVIEDALPKADLWLCRDCLFHFSYRDIVLTIKNFLRSDIRYLLTSNHPECTRNHDIPTGHFRQLNLQLPPFDFHPPLRVIDDWIEGYPVRHLALWDRKSLQSRLASSRDFERIAQADR